MFKQPPPSARNSETQAKNPRISTEAPPKRHPSPDNHYTLTLADQPLEIDSPLTGQHQQRNIALAIAAAEELRNPTGYNIAISNRDSYKITNTQIEEGIRNTRWPGRLELLRFPEGPSLLLDVAHNPAGAWTLRAAIAQLPESQPRTLLFSCLRDKDLREMTQILLPLFDSIAAPTAPTTTSSSPPSTTPAPPPSTSSSPPPTPSTSPPTPPPPSPKPSPRPAPSPPPDGLILATGSIYLVGEIRTLALNGGANPA